MINVPCEVLHRRFRGADGADEHFICISGSPDLGLEEDMARIQDGYDGILRELGLGASSAIFRRIFASDILNQASGLRESPLVRETADNPVAVSLVQQQPLPQVKVALFAYHATGAGYSRKQRLSPHDLLVERNGGRHLWTTGLCASETRAGPSAFGQTRSVFGDLVAALGREGGTLSEHCLRTWIFVKDIDVFYRGMTEGRGEVFAEQGLTAGTHYIASTGIEGACAHRHDLIAMDAYANLDLVPGQVSYLNDFDHLCAAKDYNVHFERGTRVRYADRAHLLISGTASIDRNGVVVHDGNVDKQLDRAIGNVESLLRAGGARLSDLMYLIVYLRDPADAARVRAGLAGGVPGVPVVIVQAAVCRPQWLVEIEGVAIASGRHAEFPAF